MRELIATPAANLGVAFSVTLSELPHPAGTDRPVMPISSGARGRRKSVRRTDTGATVVLICGDAEVASWPLACGDRPDLAVVNELARWQLAARRVGCCIRLRHAGVELLELLDLVGLGEVVTSDTGLRPEAGGQAEGGEQVGVEEVVMPDDPVP